MPYAVRRVRIPHGFAGKEADFVRFIIGRGFRLTPSDRLRLTVGENIVWRDAEDLNRFVEVRGPAFCLCCGAKLTSPERGGDVFIPMACDPCHLGNCKRGAFFFERGHGLVEEWGR